LYLENKDKIVGVGECGLDYYYFDNQKDNSQEVERQKLEFFNNQTTEIKNIVKELKPKSPWEGFGMRVLQSFIASILVASLIFLIIFIIKSSQEGLINTLKYFINKN
jgi:hypothetical protein